MKSSFKSLLCVLTIGTLSTTSTRAQDAKPAPAPAASAAATSAPAEDFKPDAEGFIRNWLMLAPIPLGEDNVGADFIAKDLIEKEAALAPKAGDKTKAKDQELTWKAVRSKEFSFDISELLGGQNEQVAGYMVAYLVCETELPGVTLLASSNDQGRVYFNGKDVVTVSEARTLEKDADKVKDLTLKKGVNTVVFKVINETNNWQGCLRFTDKDGKPVTGFTVKLAP